MSNVRSASHDRDCRCAETGDVPLVLPGLKPVLELVISAPERIDQVFIRKSPSSGELQELVRQCRQCGVRFTFVDTPALDRLCGVPRRGGTTIAHQGVAARLAAAGFTPLETLLAQLPDAPLPLLVALDNVQDPGNVGTLCRTLYALGGAGLIVPRHNSAYLGPAARRAAAGALERLPVARVTNLARALDSAEEAGLTIYGTGCADGADSALNAFTTPLRMPAVVVLGNEDTGLRPGVRKRCHSVLHIPLARHFDSLNVAQAGAVLLGLAAAQHLRTDAVRNLDAKL